MKMPSLLTFIVNTSLGIPTNINGFDEYIVTAYISFSVGADFELRKNVNSKEFLFKSIPGIT